MQGRGGGGEGVGIQTQIRGGARTVGDKKGIGPKGGGPGCRVEAPGGLQAVECLHVVRVLESHICTNCFRIHLVCIHPFMKF